MAKITFHFEQEGLESRTIEQDARGLSILEITEDQDIHLNHNCGGVCACSTCHIYVEQGDEHLPEITDREEDFIDRAIDPRLDSRLGCQCILLKEEVALVVTIPDQTQIIGHEH